MQCHYCTLLDIKTSIVFNQLNNLSTDKILPSEAVKLAEAFSTYTYEEIIALASSLGFSRGEVEHRRQTTSQNEMMVELLLESSNRMLCYSKRRLGQVLMNHGHIKKGLKLYPSGEKASTCTHIEFVVLFSHYRFQT